MATFVTATFVALSVQDPNAPKTSLRFVSTAHHARQEPSKNPLSLSSTKLDERYVAHHRGAAPGIDLCGAQCRTSPQQPEGPQARTVQRRRHTGKSRY
jgi:hypothetical protein